MSRMMYMFRKYQYMLLIVFGVLLMFVFVIGDALTRITGAGPRRGGETSDVVFTWKHGAVSGNDLYSQGVYHRLAVEFLSEVVRETVLREGTPKGPSVYPTQFGSFTPGITVAQSEEAIVQRMLLAAKAESLGMKVDNDAVKAFLSKLSDSELDEDDLGIIYNKTIAGRMTQQHLMDQLQRELLAEQMLLFARTNLLAPDGRNPRVSPHQAWGFHNRMHRRVQTELVALKVDDFKDQVTDTPTEDEIKALFEEGKERFPNPYSPEPGFRRRRKLGFEYIRADSGKLQEEEAAKIKDSITDEDIENHYADNKERYRVIDLPELEPDAETATPDGETPAGGDKKPASETTPEASSDAAPGEAAKEDKPKEDAAPAPPAETKPASEDPAPKKAADGETSEPPAPTEPASEPAAAEPKDGECGLQEETEPAETTDAPQPAKAPATSETTDAPAAEPSAPAEAATATPSAKPTVETPPAASNAEKPAGEEPAPTNEPAATPPAADATEAQAAGVAAETPAAEEKPEEPKYKPLDDKLREEIREEIATDRSRKPAQDRLDAAFDEIKSAIDAYGRKLRRADESKDGPKLEPVDYEKLAADHGFTPGKIDPTDAIGIEEYDLGKAYEMAFTSWPPQRVSFAQKAFGESTQVYRAQRIESAELDIDFLYWKISEEDAYIPEFEDVRDEVVDTWKRQKAFEIAKAKAKELAAKVKPDKPLGDSLAELEGMEILRPTPFSWMSTGSTPFGGAGAPTLSAVDGVEAAGNEFMKSVFGLKQGETDVAVNQPQTVVYVVRIASEFPNEALLKEQFLAAGVTPEVSQIAFVEIEDVWQDWYRDLEEELQVRWQ